MQSKQLHYIFQFFSGDLKLFDGKERNIDDFNKIGSAVVFPSFINHRVQSVTRGVRQSLVVWFGGKPFR